MGTRHVLTGTLWRDARSPFHVLEMPGGGRWRLELRTAATHLIGQAVTVEGTRAGFDLIEVERIARAARDGLPG